MNVNLLLLIAILGWGMSGVFQKLSVARIGAEPTLLVFFATGFVLAAIYCLAVTPAPLRWPGSGAAWACLSALVSVSACAAFATLLKTRDVSSIIGITACNPIVTFMIAIIFLGEQFSLARFIGICLVMLGIFILR